jgi:hypothetical protein
VRWRFASLALAIACVATSAHAVALTGACDGTPAAVCGSASAGAFPLIAKGSPAAIQTDLRDWPGVLRAAADLQADLAKVSGNAPQMAATGMPKSGPVVIVGTLGRGGLVDRLASEGKIDVRAVRGQWEAFVQQVVDKPLPGVDRALVIAGSDKRGAIFGIYDVSQRIGVSPWTWWADVPVSRRSEAHVTTGARVQKPEVRYRGIFLNDENPALLGWVHQTFGGFNHDFYERVFQLILRMKGNYLWPAMWGKAFNDDDALNARLADEYGIVMSTSHHEPMMRAQVEWARYGAGPWDYTVNGERLRSFWRTGVERMGAHESVVTVGMRGDGDEPMTQGTAISLLEKIVADQRAIIGEVTGKDPAQTPQVWALYKEVQDYYDKGMRVPQDVTLLFSDDNWGNLRRLPRPGQTQGGGFGIYYHFDYVGGPRNYKWLNTNQIERVWEQMRLAKAYGVDRLWLVNVGDLKPMEFPIEFFLDYAWSPSAIELEQLRAYPRAWAAEQFGEGQAHAIGELLSGYTKANARRKPELIGPETFSLVNFREAERVIDEWDALERRAEQVGSGLRPDQQDAYFQLVLFPIKASANLNRLYVAAGRNRLYADQGRASANFWAAEVRRLYARDAELTRRYHAMGGGKWNHMMAQTHIGYSIWQEPDTNIIPTVRTLETPAAAALGVAVEGRGQALAAGSQASLPVLNRGAGARWIDVFNRGAGPLTYTATTSAPWLRITPASGSADARLEVSVDWDRAPAGRASGTITMRGSDGAQFTVVAPVANRTTAAGAFAETDGYVAIEAEHFARKVEAAPVRWTVIPGLGRALSGVTALPATAPTQKPGGGAPRLEYAADLAAAGEVQVQIVLAPTLDFKGQGGLRYAVSIDEEAPQLVNVHTDTSESAWETSVADNARRGTSRHQVQKAGRHVVKLWLVDPGLVFERVVISRVALPQSYLGPPESPKLAGR